MHTKTIAAGGMLVALMALGAGCGGMVAVDGEGGGTGGGGTTTSTTISPEAAMCPEICAKVPLVEWCLSHKKGKDCEADCVSEMNDQAPCADVVHAYWQCEIDHADTQQYCELQAVCSEAWGKFATCVNGL